MTNQRVLSIMKVLNDDTRLKIIQMLSENGTMCACKILEELKITQGTLSHHMKVLTAAGLVSFERDGKYCNYTFDKRVVCELTNFLQNICKKAKASKGNTCQASTKCN